MPSHVLDQKIIPTEKNNKASDVFRLFLTYLEKKKKIYT